MTADLGEEHPDAAVAAMEPTVERSDDPGGERVQHQRDRAAMEPTVERSDDEHAEGLGAAAAMQPTVERSDDEAIASMALFLTTAAMEPTVERSDDVAVLAQLAQRGLPQWSRPWNGRMTMATVLYAR